MKWGGDRTDPGYFLRASFRAGKYQHTGLQGGSQEGNVVICSISDVLAYRGFVDIIVIEEREIILVSLTF